MDCTLTLSKRKERYESSAGSSRRQRCSTLAAHGELLWKWRRFCLALAGELLRLQPGASGPSVSSFSQTTGGFGLPHWQRLTVSTDTIPMKLKYDIVKCKIKNVMHAHTHTLTPRQTYCSPFPNNLDGYFKWHERRAQSQRVRLLLATLSSDLQVVARVLREVHCYQYWYDKFFLDSKSHTITYRPSRVCWSASVFFSSQMKSPAITTTLEGKNKTLYLQVIDHKLRFLLNLELHKM